MKVLIKKPAIKFLLIPGFYFPFPIVLHACARQAG